MANIRPVIPGTTPEVHVKLPGNDLTGLLAYMTFEHSRGQLTKSGDDIDVEVGTDQQGNVYSTVSASLTQRDTLSFPEKGKVKIQVRACNADGSVAVATYAGTFEMAEVLLQKFIPSEA